MAKLIKESELPIKDFEKLGLYRDGRIDMNSEDMDALVSGRRTAMRSMAHLELDGFSIRQLDAKLSLRRNGDGSVSLNLHPIYKDIQPHPLLDMDETTRLAAGEVPSIQKEYSDENKEKKKLIIEYDEDTREFVAYDPKEVEVPVRINNEELTEQQRKDFREGRMVELSDGTRLQHSASDSKGVRSDRTRLVMSVLLDGGLSYLLFRGVRHLFGERSPQKEGYSKGYNEAVADMVLSESRTKEEPTIADHLQKQKDNQFDRGYGRTHSR
jgi:hypothetical protein